MAGGEAVLFCSAFQKNFLRLFDGIKRVLNNALGRIALSIVCLNAIVSQFMCSIIGVFHFSIVSSCAIIFW